MPKNKPPKYSKIKNYAVIYLNGKALYLGIYNSPEPGKIYAAILMSESPSEEHLSEQTEMMQRQLARKIADSKQGIADKIVPPVTILHAQTENYNAHVDYEPIGSGFRFTARISENHFESLFALASSFGGDYLRQVLPFMRMLDWCVYVGGLSIALRRVAFLR